MHGVPLSSPEVSDLTVAVQSGFVGAETGGTRQYRPGVAKKMETFTFRRGTISIIHVPYPKYATSDYFSLVALAATDHPHFVSEAK